jgi:acetyltransferase-like isoleucine patch superfamily enzyme
MTEPRASAFARPKVLARYEPWKLLVIRLLRDLLAIAPGFVARHPRVARLSESLRLAELLRTEYTRYLVELARSAGAIVGENCRFYSWIVASEPTLVEIGNGVIISGDVQFVTHDGALITQWERFPDVVNHYGRIRIGDKCFLGLSSIFLPGVELGERCIVAAGSVVMESFPANSVIAGNPAKYVCPTSIYMELKKNEIGTIYDPTWAFPLKYPPHLLAKLRPSLPLKVPRGGVASVNGAARAPRPAAGSPDRPASVAMTPESPPGDPLNPTGNSGPTGSLD